MNNIKQTVEDELNTVNYELNKILSSNGKIFEELKDFINSPQKRIRSLSAILYFKACNTEINKSIISILTAGELIHNASLLHDDIIDNAYERRGKPTLGVRYSPQISILSGDLLLSLATELLINLENANIIKTFQECTREMSEAEINQYFLRGKIPKISEYIKIAEGKTASLFKSIFKSIAYICNTDTEKAEGFAKNFGILFQLKNDLETESAKIDTRNKIFTPKDILGIEKTNILIDNYQEGIRRELNELPDNIYTNGLKELLGLV